MFQAAYKIKLKLYFFNKKNYKGMAVFVHTKGGLMYEAAIGGQKFSFKAK